MNRTLGRLALVAVSLGASAALFAPSALAENAADESLVIRSIDASAYPTVQVVVQQSKPGGLALEVNGAAATGAVAKDLIEARHQVGVVFVVDGTKPMHDAAVLPVIQAKLKSLAGSMPANQQFGLVYAGVRSRMVADFSTNAESFSTGVDRLDTSTRTESSLLDGIDTALSMFARNPDLQPNIVVITASVDSGSGVTAAAVRGDLINYGASLNLIALAGTTDHRAAQKLATDSGGISLVVKPENVATALSASVSYVASQRSITFSAPPNSKYVNLIVRSGGREAPAAFTPGSTVVGGNVNPPKPAQSVLANGPSFLQTDNGKYVGIGLALVAFLLLGTATALIITRDQNSLDRVLSHYGEDPKGDAFDAEADGMAKTAFIKRAVDITSKFAERRGLVTWVERGLERADLPLRAGEALFFYVASAVLVGAATFVYTSSAVTGLIAFGVLCLMPPSILNGLTARRKKAFEAQLPDMLQLLSSTLKAGYSLMQGVEAVSREVPDPAGKELRRIVVESRLGRPLEDAMTEAGARMGSADFKWCVMAIGIQREVGGNLSELLLTVADTMVQRERLRRDVKSLTAEGRMSAYVLGILPFGIALAMYVLNKAYIMTLFTSSTGHIWLGVSGLLMVVGFLWMNKVVKVEV